MLPALMGGERKQVYATLHTAWHINSYNHLHKVVFKNQRINANH